jgi:hypothetical protein
LSHSGFRDRISIVSNPSWALIFDVPFGFTTPVFFPEGAYPRGLSGSMLTVSLGARAWIRDADALPKL